MKAIRNLLIGTAALLTSVPASLTIGSGLALLLLGTAPESRADLVIDFEHEPSLPAQPDNFAAAGAEQTYSKPGLYTISGGVVLGNPTFLPAFAAHGTPPNLYGTTDTADPSLLSTITLAIDPSQLSTSVKGVLFNGQSIAEDYQVKAFSGALLVDSNTFPGMASASDGGFANFSLTSTSAQPITEVTVTTPNATANGYDFFVDTIVVTSAATTVPEPSSIVMAALGGLALLGHGWGRIRASGRGKSPSRI